MAEDNARAALEHLYVLDNSSDVSINSDSDSDFDSDAAVPFNGTSNANNIINNAHSSVDSTQDENFYDHGDNSNNNLPDVSYGAGVSYYLTVIFP